ncbi:MAG: beta-N-acetylhexosaminidase [Gammaproteobacteria bacterium]|nr:beta-N-acetylhexosaminidase [Gammaproteobacteria bacterium]
MGPLMLDVREHTLSDQERLQLADPLVGGLILFSRNFKDLDQLKALISSIRSITGNEFIIAVDHEGGRVQRFKHGFTHIPAMAKIIGYAKGDTQLAQQYAVELGWLMAIELLMIDIDISFAPVLDLDICSNVIGDRAFSDDPKLVEVLAASFIQGMSEAGMQCTGKHFPGHGSVVADSHIAIPVDDRPRAAIENLDLSVFTTLLSQNKLDALMPAHVIYPAFDDKPAGFSPFWIKEILRDTLRFNGVIFSDDLGMAGASVAGGFDQRTRAALSAGCDMVLVCNNPQGTIEVLNYLQHNYVTLVAQDEREKSVARLDNMLPTSAILEQPLAQNKRWLQAVNLASLMH